MWFFLATATLEREGKTYLTAYLKKNINFSCNNISWPSPQIPDGSIHCICLRWWLHGSHAKCAFLMLRGAELNNIFFCSEMFRNTLCTCHVHQDTPKPLLIVIMVSGIKQRMTFPFALSARLHGAFWRLTLFNVPCWVLIALSFILHNLEVAL